MRSDHDIRRVTLAVTFTLAVSAALPAAADHHFMQIEQVIGGVEGDTSAQAIQLRMRAMFQNNMGAARIRVFDANGENPVMVIDFDTFVPNSQQGDRVLITTAAFNARTTPTTVPDFTMTNPIPESYLAAGSLTFEDDFGTVWWRLSWGGNGYTGSNEGSIFNDDDGNFGPPWPGPLPSDGVQALQFQGAASDLSSSNAADYALTAGAATFTNNARDSFVINDSGGPINATLTDFVVTFGTFISGTLQNLEESDNTFLRARSRFGFLAIEPNVVDLQVGAVTTVQNAALLDLTVEGRINQSGGTSKLRLRNWSTNVFQQVHQYPIGSTEIIETIEDVSAANRVRASDGRIELSIRQSTITTFTVQGFDSFTDHVVIAVH